MPKVYIGDLYLNGNCTNFMLRKNYLFYKFTHPTELMTMFLIPDEHWINLC